MDGFIRLTRNNSNGTNCIIRVQVSNIATYEESYNHHGSILCCLGDSYAAKESPEEIDNLIEESQPRLVAAAVPLRSSSFESAKILPGEGEVDLIIAAPDMQEAIEKAIADHVRGFDGSMQISEEAFEMLRAALNKSKGTN